MTTNTSDDGRTPRRRRRLALLALVLALIGSVAGGVLTYRAVPTTYTSQEIIGVRPVLPRMLYKTELSNTVEMFDDWINTMVELMRTERVIHHAMESERWKAARPENSPEAYLSFVENLRIRRPARTNMVVVSFTDRDRKIARIGVRAIIQAYEEIFIERDVKLDDVRLRRLETYRTTLMAQLNRARKRILAQSKGLLPDAYRQMYEWQLVELNDLDSRIRQSRVLLSDSETNAAVDGVKDEGAPSMTRSAQTDPYLRALLAEREALRRQLSLHEAGNSGHRPVGEASAALESVDRRIKTYVQHNVVPSPASAGATGDVSAPVTGATAAAIKNRLKRLEALRASHREDLLQMSVRVMKIDSLDHEASLIEQRLKDTKNRIEQLKVEEGVSGRVNVISLGDVT